MQHHIAIPVYRCQDVYGAIIQDHARVPPIALVLPAILALITVVNLKVVRLATPKKDACGVKIRAYVETFLLLIIAHSNLIAKHRLFLLPLLLLEDILMELLLLEECSLL